MNRNSARILLMQLFYQMEIQNAFSKEAFLILFELCNDADDAGNQKEFIFSVSDCFLSNKEAIDSMIEKYSSGWKLSRIAKVDLSIMRVAVTEAAFLPEDKKTPVGAAINEAVKIAKKYGTEESGKYVNGVLGELFRNI